MKQTGVRGELLVAEKLISKGWAVAVPIGDYDPVDMLASKVDVIRRIQVKSSLEQHKYPNKQIHYQFQLSSGTGNTKKKYDPNLFDFFICCALDSHRFWIIPLSEIDTVTIKIYEGTMGGKYQAFEDAWVLLEK